MVRNIINYSLLALLCLSGAKMQAQQNLSENGKATFATDGTGAYKEDILWLTWGDDPKDPNNQYGSPGKQIPLGTSSFATIKLGRDIVTGVENVLHVESKITSIINGPIHSYRPGSWTGDFLDDFYGIYDSPTSKKNLLVHGLVGNDAKLVTLEIASKATLNGVPVKLEGMVVADAEDLDNGEYFTATGFGDWNIVDMMTSNNSKQYYGVIKTTSKTDSNEQSIRLSGDTYDNIGAVTFLTFNDAAYAKDTFETTITVEFKGAGKTSIALGVLPPGMDTSDAPETYGTAWHKIQSKKAIADNIPYDGKMYNANDPSFEKGSLIEQSTIYLGSTAPDADTDVLFSRNAKGDDNEGSAGENEEDAWPHNFQQFSQSEFDGFYKPSIPSAFFEVPVVYTSAVDGYIVGWVDFNGNGVFDLKERVSVKATAAQNGTVSLKWSLPDDTVSKSTYARLRFVTELKEAEFPNGIALDGEVEDHKIYVVPAVRTNPMMLNKTAKE